jgi:hypothetical protein
MDQFADRMVARGPTLGPDRETWTGSLHIVDLPDAGAARDFVAGEPFERARLFGEHLVRRFHERLGRGMWDFHDDSDQPRFLVIAQHELTAVHAEDVIVHGDLRTADDAAPTGSALAIRAPTRAALAARLGASSDLEIHDWEFGGRR